VALASTVRMVGREKELAILRSRIDAARMGSGSAVIIFGETGIGKTRILDEFVAGVEKCKILRGSCVPESAAPFLPFREALGSGGLGALLSEGPNPRLEGLYLLSSQGFLLGKAERTSSSFDAEIFTSMLRAVEQFVNDSISRFSGKEGEDQLTSMGYGAYNILLQRSGTLTLAAIISGQGNEFLIDDMRSVLAGLDLAFGKRLKDWDGVMKTVAGIEKPVVELLSSGKYDGIDFARDDPGLRQSNILENITRGIVRQSASDPVCIIIEDLQWADPSSLALFHYLTRNTRRHRVMMMGTFRPEDLLPLPDGAEHPLKAFLRVLAGDNLAIQLELDRLGPSEVAQLVRAAFDPGDIPQELVDRIFSETDGNPMFIVELLRLLVQEGAVCEEGGIWKAREVCVTCIPARVSEVVMMRLGHLSAEQREVLDCASVAGLEFPSDILSVALDQNRLKLLKTLHELEDPYRLIHSKQDRYCFDQTRVRETLYSELSPELRKEYHRVIAGAIEKVHEGHLEPVYEQLAEHWFRAGDAGKALPLLIRAGDQAKAKYANQEALDYYSRALGLMGDDPKWAQTVADVWEDSGEVLAVMGQFDRSVDGFRKALAIASSGKLGWDREAQERSVRLLRRIAEVLETKGDIESADSGLESAIRMLDETGGAERGRVLLDKGILRWKRGDYEDAARVTREALALMEGDKGALREVSKAHNILGLIAQSRGDYDGALAEFRQSIDIDTRTGEVRSAITTNNNMGVAYWNKDEYDRAAQIFEDNLVLIRKIGDQHSLANTFNNLGLIGWNRGRYAEAAAWHQKSLEIRERIGDGPGIASCHNNLGLVHWGLGEFDAALKHFGYCLGVRRSLGDRSGTAVCLNNIGNILADRADYDGALEHYRLSLSIMEELGDKQGIAIAYNNLGDISSRQGRLDEAFGHYTESLALLEAIGDIQGVAVAYNNLGNLYIEKGEYAKTLEYFEKSRQIIEKIGDEKGLAVALNNLGDLWYYRGDDGKAHEYYTKSSKICERTGEKRVHVENLCGLAEVDLRRGNIAEAARHAGTAYDLSKAIGLREDEGWSLRILGRIYGKQGKWHKCLEYLDQGVKLYRELKLEAEEGDALVDIGQAYLDKGELDKAHIFFEKAADIFERKGMTVKAERARRSLQKMGSPGPAVERD
jgi:tetratricopeptide (TPR) repeat protein